MKPKASGAVASGKVGKKIDSASQKKTVAIRGLSMLMAARSHRRGRSSLTSARRSPSKGRAGGLSCRRRRGKKSDTKTSSSEDNLVDRNMSRIMKTRSGRSKSRKASGLKRRKGRLSKMSDSEGGSASARKKRSRAASKSGGGNGGGGRRGRGSNANGAKNNS